MVAMNNYFETSLCVVAVNAILVGVWLLGKKMRSVIDKANRYDWMKYEQDMKKRFESIYAKPSSFHTPQSFADGGVVKTVITKRRGKKV